MSVITTDPKEVLGYHATLAAAHKNPGEALTQYTASFMDSVFRKTGPAGAATMFHPVVSPDSPRVTGAHGKLMCQEVSRDLAEAVTYQVTAEMVRVMRELTGRVEEATHLDQAELPCEAGWAWFDGDWPVRDIQGAVYHIRAVSWRFLTAFIKGTDTVLIPRNWPCVRAALWVHVDDDPPEYRDSTSAGVGKLQMIHVAIIPFGIDIRVPSKLRGTSDSYISVIHMLWMFLGMEITGLQKARVKNHYRKHALRSLKHGEVNVVILRRVRHPGPEPEEHVRVDWSCQWVVQGHWRHLTNPKAVPGTPVHRAVALTTPEGGKICAVCGGELTWVRPYCKGPDGKPLKVSHTLMKLAR